MGFLGIGALEAVVIVVIALIIFGPGRLPEIMGDAGRMLRDFRRATRELTGDFEDSINEVRGTYSELEAEMRQTAKTVRSDAQAIADDVNSAVADASNLDGDKPAPRRAQKVKLDQVVDPIEIQDEDVTRYFPQQASRSANGKAAQVASASAAVSKNGAGDAGDDLLSLSDGDDLLAVDDSDR